MRGELIKRPLRRPAALLARAAMRWTRRRVGLVLVYHRVAPTGPSTAADGLVHTVSPERFQAHMRHLRRAYRMVPASQILQATHDRRRGARFPVAVTFDDELASHREHVMPALAATDRPATFFVGGRRLAALGELWWETLDRAAARDMTEEIALELGLDPRSQPDLPMIQAIAEHVLDMPPDERDAWHRRLEEQLDPPGPSGLTREQLDDLVDAGFELGFHTLRHENLVQLDDDALLAALRDGRDELSVIAGRPLTTLAYPYGRADARVTRAAATVGFAFGFTSREEPVTHATDPLLIGRIEAPDHSAGVLALDLARRITRSREPAPGSRGPRPASAPEAGDRSIARERD